jgi:hypothetical protein
MVLTFLIRCGLYPGPSEKSPDPRTTDDKFLMEIRASGDSRKVKKIKDLMKKTGAKEIKEKE